MTLDTWLAIGSVAWGVFATVLAFFAVTSDSVNSVLVKLSIKRLPSVFTDCAEKYKQADKIVDNSTDPIARNPWDERVQKKDVLAAKLGGFALGRRISRSVLAEVGDDGYLVALAEVVTAEPKLSDIPLLVGATSSTVPAHVSYRLLDAITVLARAGLIRPVDRQKVLAALDRIGSHLGAGHVKAVEHVRAEVNKPCS